MFWKKINYFGLKKPMVSIFLLFNSDLYFVNSPKKLIIEALKS